MSKSLDYYPYLISRLKNPEYAAAYIMAYFEEENPEPELLQTILSNVVEALGENSLTPEQIKEHQQQLLMIMSQPTNQAIYHLFQWLKMLGLSLNITVDQTPNHQYYVNVNDTYRPIEVLK